MGKYATEESTNLFFGLYGNSSDFDNIKVSELYDDNLQRDSPPPQLYTKNGNFMARPSSYPKE